MNGPFRQVRVVLFQSNILHEELDQSQVQQLAVEVQQLLVLARNFECEDEVASRVVDLPLEEVIEQCYCGDCSLPYLMFYFIVFSDLRQFVNFHYNCAIFGLFKLV